MRAAKRTEKENNIIDSAYKVFSDTGFKNSKMEDIAQEAGITKVTLYTYFQSKENLYMALTYRALVLLIELYEQSILESRDKNGLESSLNLLNTFMSFTSNNPLDSELLLEYFEIVRTTSSGQEKKKRLTVALQESEYYMKLEEIQNRPFKLAYAEVQRGQLDTSIKSKKDPMVITLQAWAIGLGYAKVSGSSGGDPIFNIALPELKKNLIETTRTFLQTS